MEAFHGDVKMSRSFLISPSRSLRLSSACSLRDVGSCRRSHGDVLKDEHELSLHDEASIGSGQMSWHPLGLHKLDVCKPVA